MIKAALQAVQLTIVLGMLILYPAASQPGGLYTGRVWLLYLVYWVFFALGSVRRVLRYGALADRSQDRQRSSWADRARLGAFIVAVVLLHWAPVARFCALGLYYPDPTTYEVLGVGALAAALWLNDRAARDLGAAWDRVVAPQRLVTHGVYAHVQHPIYTSYMLLFSGFAMCLHSAPAALLLLAACALHYRRRTQLESEVLLAAFGDAYAQYAARTKKFIPRVI